MNPGIVGAFVALIIAIQKRRTHMRLLYIYNKIKMKGWTLDMKMIQNLLGKRVKIRCIDSSQGVQKGIVEQTDENWILLKDSKGKEKIIKADYIAQIDILS